MEVSFGRFSIRDYTARMRRVDAGKCWPFDGDGGGGSQLPPIECRRYRWWSSELQIARSAAACERRAGAGEQACGVVSCADATVVPGAEESRGGEPSGIDGEPVVGRAILVLPAHEASTVKEDENGEEDGRQARSPGKAKVRTPKKRSIVELFAVAPQIEAAGDETEGDDDGKVLAVDKAPEEEPKHGDQLRKGGVEEPRKRREESMETLMRKKIKKNRANKNKGEENLKKKKKKKSKMKKKKKNKQKLLKTQKQQKNSIKIGIAKKEKICKPSLQSPAEFARLLHDSVVVKRVGKEIEVPVCAEGRKPTMSKRASKQCKVKTVQASKLKKQLSEQKGFPIHSILKNQKTVSPPGIGKLHITDGLQNGEGHHAQQSEKHVRFSGKDDILGQGERHCSSLGSPQMHSLCKVFSDVLEASSVMDKSPEGGKLAECGNKTQVVTADEDTASDHAEKGKTDEPLTLQQLTVIHDVTNAATSANPQGNHEEKKIALDDRVDLNSVQVLDDLNQIDPCPTEPFLKVMTSSQPEGCDAQVVDYPGKKTSRIDADKGLPSQSAAEITLINVVRNSNSEMGTCSLSADMVTNESKSHFYPVIDHNMDVYAYDSQFNSSHLLKRDRMSNICSTGSMRQLHHMDNFLESRPKANPADRFHDKHTSGNIVGLPLNSHGEYIHLQPSAQFGLDQLFKKQRMMLDPVSNFLVHNSIDPSSNDHINVKGKGPLSSAYVENQQKWVPEKFSRAQSIVMPVSGFSELQGINQTGVRNKESVRKYDQFGSNRNAEANIIRGPFHAFREQNQSHSHNDRAMAGPVGASEPGSLPVTQPTMRLMGKNFIVGNDNIKEYQGSGDSKIWADKKVEVDLHPALRMSEETTTKHWPRPEWPTHPASGTSYENLMHTLEMQEKHSASNFYHLTVDPGSDNAHLDYGLGIISGNSCHSVSFSHGYKLDTFSHPQGPEAWLSKASMSKKSRGSESESLKMGFQAPLAVCNPENVCQHLLLNSTHCKHSQSLSCSMTSAFPPSSAFQDPGNGKYSQLPLAPHSSQSLPHWLLNAGQNRNTSNPSVLSFHDPIPMHEPRIKSGHSIFPLPSPPFTSIVPFPSLGQNSHVCFSDLPTPASLVHPSLYPPFPAAKSSSTNGTCYWNMCNSRDDMKSKYPFLKGSDFANRTRKRPSPCSNDFLKPIKRPNLCTQGDSGTSMGSKRGDDLHVSTEHVSKMLELHSEDKTVKMNDVVKDAHPPSTSKLDTGSRSRPVKLSAGAKHILKPSVNMDQDNSMPTHSTIPFARGTSSGKVPVSQKKPAKIYQF